jgi:hypothetical protein
MENKISLFASLYLLMAMFLTMYIFASNILALGFALIFGILLLICPYYVFPDRLHRLKENCKTILLKIKNSSSW